VDNYKKINCAMRIAHEFIAQAKRQWSAGTTTS
jgi:hypothetical protein